MHLEVVVCGWLGVFGKSGELSGYHKGHIYAADLPCFSVSNLEPRDLRSALKYSWFGLKLASPNDSDIF